MALYQDPTTGNWRAVIILNAPDGAAAPKRDGTLGGTQQALLPLVNLVDQSGNPIPAGTASDPSVVVGNVASGATDSGAPVKVGAKFNSTPPAVTNGQRVDLQADAAGNLRINTRTSQVQVNPTITTGSAYTAGNVVGGLLTFANAVDAQLSGVLLSVTVVAKSVQTTGYKLYLFSQNPTNTTWTDKTAPSINVADLPYLVDVITLGAADSGLGTMAINATDAINRSLVLATTSLYGVLVCTGTPTYTNSTGLYITASVLKD